MKRIHDSLGRVFERHRLVFWYDPKTEWTDAFDSFAHDDVTKLTVLGNEFGTKVHIARAAEDARFLIYFPALRPPDADNWLLDLLLQGYEYRADKASLSLEEVGLPSEFLHIAEEHATYFNSGKRLQALKELIRNDDQPRDVRLKMMAVLADTAVEVDAMLLCFLGRGLERELMDPVSECFDAAALTEPFWREIERLFGYTSAEPSLRDFAVSLFRAANPFDQQVALHPHARVFLQRWKDSQAHSASFREWAHQMQQQLQIAATLDGSGDVNILGDSDTFEIFERFTLHRLCRSFTAGAHAADLRAILQRRRSSFWYSQHEHGYAAVEHALELRELLAAVDLTVDSIANGLTRYVSTWWQIDTAYRRSTLSLRRYGQVQLMEQIAEWVEKSYVNNFLLPLADRWSDQVRGLERWESADITAQRRFFEEYVRPFISKGQKVFVVISDALRYEAAAEFTQRLRTANRWTAEIDVLLGSLPSYTQLGMAALLPGKRWAINADSALVSIDGRSAGGIPARAEILSQACEGKATALQAETFLELNTKTDGRALMRDHDVIYISQNVIDKIGDASATEAKTLEAVEQAFTELEAIIKKVANINGTNMLLTADHGFLFQQNDVDDGDSETLPPAAEWTFRGQRFSIGRGIVGNPNVKVFDSSSLELDGDWAAAFPLSLKRFPRPGSGKRYVHGGISLQEVVVPVIKIHKARSDDTGRVEVELIRVPAKITTGQLSIVLFQDRSAVDKILPRSLRIGVYAKDGTVLSEMKTLTFDSREAEARQRESTVILVLSHAADAHNNNEVIIRLEEAVPGTSQLVTYKAQSVKLQKPFTSDFDEH